MGTPQTLEEFGIPRDSHSCSPASPVTCRGHNYELMCAEIYRSACSGSAMAGSNFWGWRCEGRASDPTTYIWNKWDDYAGDPPQEPQRYQAA